MEISRNQPCPCGSGKKYKRCCSGKDRMSAARARSERLLVPGFGPLPARARADEEALDMASDGFEARERRVGMANAMMRFAEPLLKEAGDNPASQEKALTLAGVFWNMAIVDDGDYRAEFLSVLMGPEGPCTTEEDRQYLREMAERMILRHKEMFPGLHRIRVH